MISGGGAGGNDLVVKELFDFQLALPTRIRLGPAWVPLGDPLGDIRA